MPYKGSEKQKEYMKKYREENKENILAQKKKYYQENKENILAQKKKYYQENKEQKLAKRKEYYQENKEKQKEYMKRYHQENREQIKKTAKKYREKNRDALNVRSNNYKSERYHTDPCYKLKSITSAHVRRALKSGKGGKSILPYVDWNSYEELKEHLESQFEDWMTWENHGNWHPTEKRWHIEHIKPQSVLLEGVTSMDDPKFRECWALENLRPLEAMENIIKGNKLLDEKGEDF